MNALKGSWKGGKLKGPCEIKELRLLGTRRNKPEKM